MNDEVIRVRFISGDAGFSELVSRTLGPGFSICCCNRLSLWREHKEANGPEVILLDLDGARSGVRTGHELHLMEEIKRAEPYTPIIAMIAYGDDNLAYTLIGRGAFDTLASPPNIAELRLLLRRAYRSRLAERELSDLRRPHTRSHLGAMIGAGRSMSRTFELARKLASCDISVLITGETGTGKNLLARTIHRLSSRSSGPFVGFSCANLPEALVEDELFGHERGAFTGAIAARQGRFEAASGGTLFLDEIGDLPLRSQAKLLQVLQQRAVERLGSNGTITTDHRVICATHCNLERLLEEGRFRKDLYYRLNVAQVHIPPLRERREEIPILTRHFLSRYAQQFQREVKGFSSLAMHALEEYAWPGNVRELENTVQRAVVMADGTRIELWHLPRNLRDGYNQGLSGRLYEEEVREFKRRLILRALVECGGRKTEVARSLGVARSYLHRLINQLQIACPEEFAENLSDLGSSLQQLI